MDHGCTIHAWCSRPVLAARGLETLVPPTGTVHVAESAVTLSRTVSPYTGALAGSVRSTRLAV